MAQSISIPVYIKTRGLSERVQGCFW